MGLPLYTTETQHKLFLLIDHYNKLRLILLLFATKYLMYICLDLRWIIIWLCRRWAIWNLC